MARIEEAALNDRLEWDPPLFRMNEAFDRYWEVAHSLRTAALVTGVRDVAAGLDAHALYP